MFKEKKIDLFDLYNDLGGIINNIESISDSWRLCFCNEINKLEAIYDCIEDGTITKWQGSFEKDQNDAVELLKEMSQNILEEYLKIPDSNIQAKAIRLESDWLMCPECYEAWQSNFKNAMIICPTCESVLHNPIIKPIQAN